MENDPAYYLSAPPFVKRPKFDYSPARRAEVRKWAALLHIVAEPAGPGMVLLSAPRIPVPLLMPEGTALWRMLSEVLGHAADFQCYIAGQKQPLEYPWSCPLRFQFALQEARTALGFTDVANPVG